MIFFGSKVTENQGLSFYIELRKDEFNIADGEVKSLKFRPTSSQYLKISRHLPI